LSVLITLATVVLVVNCFLMLGVILLQRGRGGGLASAFGGLGAEAAFGTRAATLAQKITVVCAVVFLLLSMLLGYLKSRHDILPGGVASPPAEGAPAEPQ